MPDRDEPRAAHSEARPRDEQDGRNGRRDGEASTGAPWERGWQPYGKGRPIVPRAVAYANLALWFRERLGFNEMVDEALHHPVPRKTSIAELFGFFTLFSFVNQIITGCLLLTFYQPTTSGAWESMHAAQSIPIERFIRGLHYWGANAMVVLVGMHMLRVIYVAAYKKPREFQWITGIMMLGLVIGLAFTGYLLPWDQQAYWATMVGTAIAGYTPVLGPYLVKLMRGSDYITGATLNRFFAVHAAILPILLALILGLHLYLVFAHGQTEVERSLPKEYREKHRLGETKDFPQGDFRPFWPYTIWQMIGGALVLLAILTALALVSPAPLIAKADPLNRAHYDPVPIWFFLWIYQLLKYTPPVLDTLVMIGLPAIGGILMILLPWLDRNPRHEPRHRPIALSVTGVITVGVLSLTYIGYKAHAPLPTTAKVITSPKFAANIHPLLLQSCKPCHTSLGSGGLMMTSYATLMKGGINGKVIQPGDPAHSLIILALEGKAPHGIPQMPLGKQPLPKGDIQTIANWIKAGAKNN